MRAAQWDACRAMWSTIGRQRAPVLHTGALMVEHGVSRRVGCGEQHDATDDQQAEKSFRKKSCCGGDGKNAAPAWPSPDSWSL